jgi:hypothetical protein
VVVIVAATLGVCAAGCGGSSGPAGPSGTPTPTASRGRAGAEGPQAASAMVLQADVRRVKAAPTVGGLSAAREQLARDLARAARVPSSANPTVHAEWQQALAMLAQAEATLTALAAQFHQSSAPSPLRQPGADANPVKDILDDLNSAYDLLEKVIKDLAALRRGLRPSATPTPTVTPTATPTATPTPTAGTFTLTIVNENPADGEVYVGDITAANHIACGGAQTACKAQEQVNAPIGISFDGFYDNTGKPYLVASVRASPPGCPTIVGGHTADCSLSADTNTTITVSWKLSSSP